MTVSTTKRWEQKELVQSLRRQGLSYREILSRAPFTLARSTISSWCKDIDLTAEQLDRLDKLYRASSYRNRLLGSKTTQRRRVAEVEAIEIKAREEVSRLRQNELWLAGLMLYWAEGDKTHRVGLSNSDARLVRFMMRWFREICCVPEGKFRARLHVHTGQDDDSMKAFWSRVTDLPLSKFGKSYMKREGTGHRKNMLYQGTIAIHISSKDLLYRIHGWIEGFSKIVIGPLAQSVERLTLNQ